MHIRKHTRTRTRTRTRAPSVHLLVGLCVGSHDVEAVLHARAHMRMLTHTLAYTRAVLALLFGVCVGSYDVEAHVEAVLGVVANEQESR